MISLYKKSLHSLLSFTTDTPSPKSNNYDSKLLHQSPQGLGLISDDHSNNLMQFKSPNILQSSSLLITKPRKDPAARVGFIHDVRGDDVSGLTSCTESLGFESSDERLVSDDMIGGGGGGCVVRAQRRRKVPKRKFPPPLSTLNHHGQPNFYLLPVRKDGRLELTEVRIERTDVLRACREDGRLRLHLIKEGENGDDDNDRGDIDKIEVAEEEEVEGLVKEEKLEFRRCVEVVNQQRRREHHRGRHQHHQHLDVWRQHCLTTS